MWAADVSAVLLLSMTCWLDPALCTNACMRVQKMNYRIKATISLNVFFFLNATCESDAICLSCETA